MPDTRFSIIPEKDLPSSEAKSSGHNNVDSISILPEGTNMLRFLYCDTGNIIRGKVSRISNVENKIKSGIGLVKGMMAMNILDEMQLDTGYGATGEVRLVPDFSTLRKLPYCMGSALAICDLIELDKRPWDLCPRDILKKQIKKCLDLGVRFEAAFEPEFFLGKMEGEKLVPIDNSNCFSTDGMNRAGAFIEDFASALELQKLQVELYYPELGHGQHELSIKHSEALSAADNQILYRETLRGVAYQHGLVASLAPKPIIDGAGNGCHLHISAWNQEENLFWSQEGLSDFGKSFVAGLIEHLPALTGICCPTVNSYRRLKPKSWSSAYTCWGYENREAAIRVPSQYWDMEKETTNLEIKCVDSSSNPYLALAAIIAAGMDGVKRNLRPPNPVDGDPSTLLVAEAKKGGIHRLPESLKEALDKLQADEILTETLGTDFANTFVTVKRSEYLHFNRVSQEEEINTHLNKF